MRVRDDCYTKKLPLIDGKDLCNGLWERCINACKEIFLLDDADGAMVIFYYYILNMPMSEIVNILHISKRSCWRHHGIAMDDLDYVLSLNALDLISMDENENTIIKQ